MDSARTGIENIGNRLGIENPRSFADGILKKAGKKGIDKKDNEPEEKPEEKPITDSVSIGANAADHLHSSPMLEKLGGLIASALVVSGVSTFLYGIKHGERQKILAGSKQTLWGIYYGLNAIDTVFQTSMAITPGLRAIGGLINLDIGLSSIYYDYKKNGKLDTDRTLFHSSMSAWGLRHSAAGLQGLGKSAKITNMAAKNSAVAKALVSNAPLMGALGIVFGAAGGVLDTALGVRNIIKGNIENNKEKKIIGALDITTGVAMGVSCALTGIPGLLAVGVGSAAMGIKFWRTEQKMIKEVWGQVKEKATYIKDKIKDGFNYLFGGDSPGIDPAGENRDPSAAR